MAIAGLVVATALTVVFVVSLAALGDVRMRNEQEHRSSDTIQAAGQALSQVLNLETGLRGYVIARDPAFLAPFDRARTLAPGTLRRLETLAADDPRQAARARRLRAAITDYSGPYARAVISGVRRGDRGSLAREGKNRVDAIRALIATLTATEEAEQAARRAEADRSSRRATVVGIGGLVLLFAVFGTVLAYTARVIVRPLTRLTRAAREIRGGDLHARVPERSAAELGELEQTFNAMAGALEARTEELERYGASRAAMLDAVFAQSPFGLAFFEPDGNLLRANAALQGMHGLLADPPAAHAPLGPEVAEAVAGVAASGEPATDLEVAGESREGGQRWWRASLFPVRPTGARVAAIGAVIVEITTERLRAETVRRRLELERVEAQRTARLDQLGEALGEAVSVDQAATVVVTHAIRALDADAGLILLVDDIRGDLALQAAVGHTTEDLARWRRISRSRPTPAVEALRRRAPIAITDAGELRGRWPSMAAAGVAATLSLPLALDDLDVGALSLSWMAPRPFAADEVTFIARVADRAAQALQRARLYEREHDIADVLQRSLLPEALPELRAPPWAAASAPRAPARSWAATSTTPSRSTTPGGWPGSATSAARARMRPRSRRWPVTPSRRGPPPHVAERARRHPRRRPAAPRLARGALPDGDLRAGGAHGLRLVGRSRRGRTPAAAAARGRRTVPRGRGRRAPRRAAGGELAGPRARARPRGPPGPLHRRRHRGGRPRARAGAQRAVRGARHRRATDTRGRPRRALRSRGGPAGRPAARRHRAARRSRPESRCVRASAPRLDGDREPAPVPGELAADLDEEVEHRPLGR